MSRDILLSLIDADPGQPRRRFDETSIAELAQSMDAKGLVIPIMVRPVEGRFIIVHGERRYKAALSLGWETICAEVRDVTPTEARWLALIENIQREDLSPIEEATAYQVGLTQEDITQAELGERIGKSQSYIASKVRLLGLPHDIQESLEAGALTEGHAKQLLRLSDSRYLVPLYEKTLNESLSVRALKTESDRAISFIKAQKAIEEIETENRIESASGAGWWDGPGDMDTLLEGIGCEIPWGTFWDAEDFQYCGGRLVGIFARLIWMFEPLQIFAYGWSPQDRVAFDSAKVCMRREKALTFGDADLVFVNLVPSMSDEEVIQTIDFVASNLGDTAAVAFRSGPHELGETTNYKDMAWQIETLRKGLRVELPIASAVATEFEREAYLDRVRVSPALQGKYRDCLIPSCEFWTVFSASGEIGKFTLVPPAELSVAVERQERGNGAAAA